MEGIKHTYFSLFLKGKTPARETVADYKTPDVVVCLRARACVYVCVCVCVRERERERERDDLKCSNI